MSGSVARGAVVAVVALLAAGCTDVVRRDVDPVLDKHAQLARFDFWDNRDADWFAERIPFLETPDAEIDETWYYRWEVLTKHLVYGSPEDGYTLTEFIDRPFWSGAYGAISCPLGHQLYELRWLKDRRIVEDFARYWLTAEGAEPRSYSNWYGDGVWATYRVLGDEDFAVSMLPLMVAQYEGWVDERWDPEHRMFRWDGMHDGMETNISSRQTPRWFDGAEGYRPTLNSYLYADAVAIAKAAALAGDDARAAEYRHRAEGLKARVQEELWDPQREFFFHQFADDEETVADPWPGVDGDEQWRPAVAGATLATDGSTPPIEARSLVYESGPWAGSPHGREAIGFVPWQFGLPDPGHETAWKFLFDPEHFWTEYGPTTTEQGDPLFYVSPRCCVWSGNSWPYATTQTLVALANLLHDYDQDVVAADDYFRLLKAYTRLHRKDGRPYVAEAADPYTGSWSGHDTWFHSEHYLHSGYIEPVITGLVGLRPQDDDTLVVNPLVPADWDWFALDDVAYRGHRVGVLWDRDGSRYGRGAGLQVLVDGEVAASASAIERLEVALEAAPLPAVVRRHNVAVNNGKAWFPAASASSFRPEAPPDRAVDGQFWYHTSPPNRWVTSGVEPEEWFEVDFGVARRIDAVKLYFLDDDARPADPVAERAPGVLTPLLVPDRPALPPDSYRLLYSDGSAWVEIPGQRRLPESPAGRRANVVRFPALDVEVLRVELVPRADAATGLAEIEAWTDAPLPLAPPSRIPENLAFNPGGDGYPSVSASHAAAAAPVTRVVDGETAFNLYTDKRWTAVGTEDASDWIAVDFGEPRTVRGVDLYLWAWPGRGTAAPASYRVQVWHDGAWQPAEELSRSPAEPLPLALNRVQLEPVTASRLRVVLEHAAEGVAAVSELVVRGH